MNTLLCILFLFALVMALRQIYLRLSAPLTVQEVRKHSSASDRREYRKALAERRSPDVWVKKEFGPLGVRGFRAAEFARFMVGKSPRAQMRLLQSILGRKLDLSHGLANVAEGFYDGGTSTYYPTDVVPNSTSNPYANRYVLVKQGPVALPAALLSGGSLYPGWAVSPDDTCTIMAAGDTAIPLAIMTDDIGNELLSQPPYSGTATYLGNSNKSTNQLVTDSAIPAGAPVIVSRTTAGYGGVLPNIAGLYWCVGLAISTSEGLGTLVELDPGRFPLGIDVIT